MLKIAFSRDTLITCKMLLNELNQKNILKLCTKRQVFIYKTKNKAHGEESSRQIHVEK